MTSSRSNMGATASVRSGAVYPAVHPDMPQFLRWQTEDAAFLSVDSQEGEWAGKVVD